MRLKGNKVLGIIPYPRLCSPLEITGFGHSVANVQVQREETAPYFLTGKIYDGAG